MTKAIKRTRFEVWKNVIFALFLREIKSRFNDKIGLAWTVIQPIMFIIILSLMRGRLDGGVTHSIPTFVFMFFGMSTVLLFMSTMNAVYNSIKKNKALFAFRQVTPIAAVISSAFFEMIAYIFIYIIMYMIMYFLKIEIVLFNFLLLLLCVVSTWLIAISVGLIFALIRSFIPEFDKVKAVIMRPMLFISGVFFSLQDLPRSTWKYFDWNPVLHAIELIRQAAYPSFGAIGVSLGYLLFLTLTLVCFALATYTSLWKMAISN
ncbi:ABC transporter permease [Vibrio sinaloensis]|uniref:ABC transporter permease n=1 Tax=Photobacterium sp. (strain ATCC 43367) TaxID=379097 RepID=UPI0035E99D27